MGSYLSRPRPWPLPSSLPGEDPRVRAQVPGAAPPSDPGPPARQVHSEAPTLDMVHRLLYEDLAASARRRRHQWRFVIVYLRRQYPVRQARRLFLGIFSSVPKGNPQKPALSACSSRMFYTSLILKVASAKGKRIFRLALEQSVICMWSSLLGHLSNHGVKEVKALEHGFQLRAKEEKDPTALADSRIELVQQEEGHPLLESQDQQRRSSDGSRGAQSAFRCLMVNGVLYSFVPRPGPLRRDFCSESPQNSLLNRSQTCFLSSCSKRNAITSSYSSTRGSSSLQKLWDPVSSLPQATAEKASGESHSSSASASAEPLMITPDKVADVSAGQKQNLSFSPACDSSRPRKRKIPLLLPCRRNDPLILPPPLQLGYQVRAEDLDLEKRAGFQWINKILEG